MAELIALLRDGAARAPDQPVILSARISVSYADMLARSTSVARALRARGIERFACVLSEPHDVISLLCGSSAIGAEACMYPPAADDVLIDEYATAFDHSIVVADRPLRITNAVVVNVDELAHDGDAPDEPPPASPTLILTTGTTGRPKGVRHDWSRLVAASRYADAEPGARWLLAYNLNQFAGIQILLHVLRNRATLVVPASSQPGDVVAALKDFGVTHLSATPTFVRLLVARLDAATARELAIRQITLGGEAVPASVLDTLTTLFPDANISQVYAATEFGSLGSVRDGRNGLPISVLERRNDSDIQARIVDGELQLLSRVGMLGYYGEPDVAAEWRSTGDLVEVRDDRIMFVGRTSETINVGGVKVHPLPVEERASAIEGVEVARAYGRPNSVTGQIVVLDVVAIPGADRDRIERDIRATCESLVPAARPRRIRFVDDLELRGQKISRGSAHR